MICQAIDQVTRRSIHKRSYDSSRTYAGRTTSIPQRLLFTKHGAPTTGVNMSARAYAGL